MHKGPFGTLDFGPFGGPFGLSAGGEIKFLTSSVSTTAATVAAPDAAITAADFMIAYVSQLTNANDIAVPAGWSLIGRQNYASNFAAVCAWAPGGTDMQAGNWTATSAVSFSSLLLCYSGVDLADPIGGTAIPNGSNSAAFNIEAAALVAPGRNKLIGFHTRRSGGDPDDILLDMTFRRRVFDDTSSNNIAGHDLGPIGTAPTVLFELSAGAAHMGALVELRAA